MVSQKFLCIKTLSIERLSSFLQKRRSHWLCQVVRGPETGLTDKLELSPLLPVEEVSNRAQAFSRFSEHAICVTTGF